MLDVAVDTPMMLRQEHDLQPDVGGLLVQHGGQLVQIKPTARVFLVEAAVMPSCINATQFVVNMSPPSFFKYFKH